MDSSESQPSISFKSKKQTPITSLKPAQASATPQDPNPNLWSSKTPEKPTPKPSQRVRNRGVALSVKDVRKIAEGLRESGRDRSDPRRISSGSDSCSARKQILSWPSESPVDKSRNLDDGSNKLPEKYEMLVEFFNCLDSSIRLLRLKGSMCTFTNICPKVESLTDRRFSYGHLAQLKFILPEAIMLKKMLSLDERTSCMKPDLHVSLEVDAIKNDGHKKSGSGNLHLRKVFRARLLDFVKSHPEGDEIPEETLPEPFNRPKQELYSETIEGSSSSLLVETTTNADLEEQPAVASHLSRMFNRRFSQKVSSHEAQNTLQKEAMDSFQISSIEASTACVASSSIKPSSKPTVGDRGVMFKASPHRSLSTQLLATPSKLMDTSKIGNSTPARIVSIEETPAKLTSTPANLMASTPALQTPKRCPISPEDEAHKTPEKLVRRALRQRSLKFDTPVKNTDVGDQVNKSECSREKSDIYEILPENLLQSIREKEMKAVEERDPAISEAKRRREMIAGLPKLFNKIHFLFQSINRSVVTKEELIHKIIASHCDIVDRRELEEQLQLLQELVPDWISEKLASSGDHLLCINKTSSTELIRQSLAEAK